MSYAVVADWAYNKSKYKSPTQAIHRFDQIVDSVMTSWIPAARQACVVLSIAFACVVALTGGPASAQNPSVEQASQTTPNRSSAKQDELPVMVGVGGTWKLGHPCPLRITLTDQFHQRKVAYVEVDSVDGDGVAVTYRKSIDTAAAKPDKFVWLGIQIGRPRAILNIRLLTSDHIVVAEREIDPSAEAIQLASTQPFIVALGASMGVEALSLKSASNSSATLASVVIDEADKLPPNLNGYTACDLLLISTSDLPLLKAISEQQWAAIDGWIRGGGGCIVSLGRTASELSSVPEILDFIPGKVVGEGLVTNPGGLESLVGVTEDPLKPFPATLVELSNGAVKLMLSDSLSRRFPWWIAYARGQGTVRVVASDMDTPALANWKDRRVLWDRLIEPYFARSMLESTAASEDALAGASSYLGYNDLVGQLRATLDVFDQVRVVTFGQVAAILIGVLVLVGPLDYFVSVKWLKRPAMSWVFAGVLLIAISTFLTLYYQKIRPDDVLVNTAQIVDVDVETGLVDGRLWSHIYSGSARRVDIEIEGPPGTVATVDWQGLPGAGLGGLTSQLNTDRGMPGYTIDLSTPSGSAVVGVGIPAAGTKGLHGRWGGSLVEAELGAASPSDLQELAGVDQLQGTLTNPLSVDLRDAILFYHDWYYVLNSRIAAGEKVSISSEQIPKDLTRRLNRQRSVDGNVRVTRWDPGDRGELDRLLELMMFYKAASGANYASLLHRYQPHVDHSNLLELDRAVLIGRSDLSPSIVNVRAFGEEESDTNLVSESGIDRVWYRLVYPVDNRRK